MVEVGEGGLEGEGKGGEKISAPGFLSGWLPPTQRSPDVIIVIVSVIVIPFWLVTPHTKIT